MENNITVKNKVFQTKDYGVFKRLNGNRIIDKTNLKNILESIKSNNLEIPIIVNEKMEICEGQHRFECKNQLNLPVDFIIKAGYGLKETRILNSHSKDWTPYNYMTSWCDEGFGHYLLYRTFFEKYKYPHKSCRDLLSGGIDQNDAIKTYKTFKNGSFKVSDYNKACKYADKILMVKEYYEGYKRRSFILAMVKMFSNKGYRHERFMDKLKYNRKELYDCTNFTHYYEQLKKIYNWKVRKENVLRFD